MPCSDQANTIRLHPQNIPQASHCGQASRSLWHVNNHHRTRRYQATPAKCLKKSCGHASTVAISHHIKQIWPLRIAELSVNLHRKAFRSCCQKGRRDWVILGPWAKTSCKSIMVFYYNQATSTKHTWSISLWTGSRVAQKANKRHRTRRYQATPAKCLKKSCGHASTVAISHHIKQIWPLRIAELSVNLHRKASDHAVRKGAEIGSS